MKAKLEAVKEWCYNHIELIASGFIILLLLAITGGMCGCTSSETIIPKQDAHADISGIYVVNSGYQTILDNQGTDKTTNFKLADGLQVSVSQADNAVKVLNCLGVLQQDLTVDSHYPFAQFYMGTEGCETVTCFFEYKGGGAAYLYIHTDVIYSMFGFMGTSDIELELLLDRTLDETDCAIEVELKEEPSS
jgi:hypothetical protein